jgi:hypothetical protein
VDVDVDVDEEKIDENQENQTISPILLSRYLISRKVTVVEDLGGQLALYTRLLLPLLIVVVVVVVGGVLHHGDLARCRGTQCGE